MNHSNFVDNQTIRAQITSWSGGSNVSLTQRAGSMDFQFSMTPTQARILAADLLALADEVEQVAVEQVAA